MGTVSHNVLVGGSSLSLGDNTEVGLLSYSTQTPECPPSGNSGDGNSNYTSLKLLCLPKLFWMLTLPFLSVLFVIIISSSFLSNI